MPEIQCPMCSKTNEADAEECHFCGARLKPLVLDADSTAKPEDAPRGIPEEDEEPWEDASEIAERISAPIEPPEEPEVVESTEEPITAGPAEEADDAGPEEEAESPDWLDTLRPPGRRRDPEDVDEEAEPEKKPRGTDWLRRLRTIESSADAAEGEVAAVDGVELARAEIPDWLHVVHEDSAEAVDVDKLLLAESLELGDRLAVHTPGLPVEDVPGAVEAPAEPVEELDVFETPVAPSMAADDAVPVEGELEEIDIEPVRDPESTPYVRTPEPATLEDIVKKPRIARAVLPSWLEALRPIDALRTLEEVEDEEGQPVETIGPLAGLSDVLVAEPVIATPRTPGVASPIISTTKRENEQARILRRLVETERQVIAPAKARLRVAPILRWIIGLFLVAAVALPSFRGDAIFPSPRWVPQDLGMMRGLIEDLPHDRPALVVADYDPGYAAELEAVGSSLVDHLFQRGMSIVTLSTRPTGPVLAQRLIDNVSAWQDIEAGENYLHLGYLSGGPTAIQLFASNPRYGGLSGFLLPVDWEWDTPWEAPILSGVDSLDDFGVVVVITAGTETARTWAEQAAPQTGDTSFIMVLSAGAEPLMRPYYSDPDRQVDAIYTGLPSAKANELLNGRSGDASLLWDAFGTGGWAAIAILAVGGIVGAATSLLRRGSKEDADV
jgi:hypothetical protein